MEAVLPMAKMGARSVGVAVRLGTEEVGDKQAGREDGQPVGLETRCRVGGREKGTGMVDKGGWGGRKVGAGGLKMGRLWEVNGQMGIVCLQRQVNGSKTRRVGLRVE